MSIWQLRKRAIAATEAKRREVGELIPPKEHRCKPPKCHEWPAGEWKVSDRVDLGTEWVCPKCEQRWRVTTRRNGLWKNWDQVYDD